MAPRRKPASNTQTEDSSDVPTAVTILAPTAPAPAASSLPAALRFPLYAILSFSLSALSKSLYYELNGPALEIISRDGNPAWRLAVTSLWKSLELGIGWIYGFDALDMLCFTVLTHAPHAVLLHTFYTVSFPILAFLLLTTSLSNALPLHLLHRRAGHNLPARQTDERIASSWTVRILTTLLPAVVYSLPLLISYATWLPSHLAVHFPGLRTLAPAHDIARALPYTASILLPLGACAMRFSFAPAVHPLGAAPAAAKLIAPSRFDAASATLSETLHRNLFWHLFLPVRAQLLFRRSVALILWTAANTAFWAWIELDGAELVGALGWGMVWGVGAAASSLTLGWVAGVLD